MPRQYDYYNSTETPESEIWGKFGDSFNAALFSGIERSLARKEKRKDVEMELAGKGYKKSKIGETYHPDTPKIEIFGDTYYKPFTSTELADITNKAAEETRKAEAHTKALLKEEAMTGYYNRLPKVTNSDGTSSRTRTESDYAKAKILGDLILKEKLALQKDRLDPDAKTLAKWESWETKIYDLLDLPKPIEPVITPAPIVEKKGGNLSRMFGSMIEKGKDVFGLGDKVPVNAQPLNVAPATEFPQIQLPSEIKTTSQAMQYLTTPAPQGQGLTDEEAARWLRDNQ